MTANEIQAISSSQLQAADSVATLQRESLPKLKFHRDFATIVKGIRRCGKSTLAHQWQTCCEEKVFALNFDDLRMMTFQSDDFKVLDRTISQSGATALVFDEIHGVSGWELYVRQKIDQGFKVLVTGSNAALLSRELGTKLSGRHVDFELSPFSYSEYLRFTGQDAGRISLEAYLRDGGFPGYLRTKDPEVLKNLVNDIIYRDIAVRHNIRDVAPLRSLCLFLLGNASKRTSPSRLKEAMRVKSATTMLEYFGYFEDAYLINRLEAYSPSAKSRLLAPKKTYVADTALTYAFNVSHSQDYGNMLENAVYHHLRRRADQMYYHDDGSSECDFVVRDADGWSAVQVTWKLEDGNQDREFDGLVRAMTAIGAKKGLIITDDQSDFAIHDGCEIDIVPAWRYFSDACEKTTKT